MKAKKTIMKNLVIAFLGVSSILMNAPATAASGDLEKDTGIHIIYAGKDVDFSVFRLVVTKQQTQTYLVTIKSDAGATMFTEKLKGDSLIRTYKFPSDIGVAIGGTSIEVKNLNTQETEIYQIKAVSHIVDQVSITKL